MRLGGARKEGGDDPVSEALWRRRLRSAADGPVHGAKAAAVALLVASLVFGTASVASAEWPPGGPPKHCSPTAWHSHRNGPGRCGWHNPGSLIGRVFKQHAGYALCIARRESGLRPRATNGQYRGLFQFGSGWYAGRWNPYNPVLNTLHAYAGSRGGTYWAPWGWGCG